MSEGPPYMTSLSRFCSDTGRVAGPQGLCLFTYRGTSPIRKRLPLGPYRRPVPRVLGGSVGDGRSLMGEVPL